MPAGESRQWGDTEICYGDALNAVPRTRRDIVPLRAVPSRQPDLHVVWRHGVPRRDGPGGQLLERNCRIAGTATGRAIRPATIQDRIGLSLDRASYIAALTHTYAVTYVA